MGLESLVEIQEFLVDNSLTAFLDIGGHLLTGAFLTERYFPEAEKSKKAVLAFCSGLIPDFDYFTFGIIPHKTATHTIAFGGLATVSAYNANQEDMDREGFMPSIDKRAKSMLTSRWAKLTGLGVGLHLSLDFIFRENLGLTVTYFGAAALALGVQLGYNKTHNKGDVEKTFRIHPCVVKNKEGERFWVSEQTQAHSYGDEHKGYPHYQIDDYVYGEESRELVRVEQKKQSGPNFWEKVDDFCLRVYLGTKNKILG
jgi:hypothetical protein